MKKKLVNPHDKLFRASMDHPEVVKEFLLAHLPESIKCTIDFSTVHSLPCTFIDEDLKLSQTDVLIMAKINNRTGLIYILVEHQSTVDRVMPYRGLKYLIKIWDYFYIINKKSSAFVFPVIIPIIFYTGAGPYTESMAVWDLCGENSALMKEVLSNPFHLVDANLMKEDELQSRLYSGTMEFILRHQFRRDCATGLRMAAQNLCRLALENNDEYLLKLVHYILAVDEEHYTITDLMKKIHYHIPELTGEKIMGLAERIYLEGEEKGIEKGIEQGIEQGFITAAKNMLRAGAAPEFVAKVTELPLSTIKEFQAHFAPHNAFEIDLS